MMVNSKLNLKNSVCNIIIFFAFLYFIKVYVCLSYCKMSSDVVFCVSLCNFVFLPLNILDAHVHIYHTTKNISYCS